MTLSRRTLLASSLMMTLPIGLPARAASEPMPDMALGQADAPITLVEYASFTCPHCARFQADVFPKLKEEYIDTGKVRFVFREVYFDRFGLWGGALARCGGEARYFPMVALLLEHQSAWMKSDKALDIVESMKGLGRKAGLSNAQMDGCLQDQNHLKALVEDFRLKAGADNIDSTPSLTLNGEKIGNKPWDRLKALLDAKLAELEG